MKDVTRPISIDLEDAPDSTRERLRHYLQCDLLRIEKEIKAHIFGSVGLVNDVSKYIIHSGGKRLRPLLTILCARLCGYRDGNEVPLAVAFEFLHAATLLHDDVIDHAELRRNKPAANTLWGNQAVVLVGDFLYSKSLMISLQYNNIRLMEVLARASGLMAEGEIMQLLQLGNIDITEEEYFEIIYRKTAVLISSACQAGAILGEASPEEEKALKDYGYHLGMAFQLIDDVLDYTGTRSELGKPVGKDFEESKATLPLICAFRNAPDEQKQEVRRVFSNPEGLIDFEWIKNFVHEHGGIEYTMNVAGEHINNAQECLSTFPPGKVRNILYDLAEYVITRRY